MNRYNYLQEGKKMISSGHLVQDWVGRVGIALDPCEPPESDELDHDLDRVVRHWGGRTGWWRVALLSGTIVKSPERATDSWGPADRRILEWAIRQADKSIAEQLKSISPAGETEQGPS